MCLKTVKHITVMPSSHCQHRQDKTVMPSSHCQRRQDKTVLSRRRCEPSWRQSQTVFSLRCEHTCITTLDPVSKYDVTIGNHIANWKLGQDKTRLSSHHISRLDKTVLKFSDADSHDLSPIQFTQQMPTRQDSLVLSVSAV